MPVRVPVAALVLVLGLTSGVVAIGVLSRPAPRVPATPGLAATITEADQGPGPTDALVVLRDWDRRRAAAWAAGDERALERLYAGRSAAGLADVALLRRYEARGLVVHGMTMQVLAARRLKRTSRVLELEVTDRLASATVRVSDGGVDRLLPADTARTRVLVLRRVGARWLMARVSAPSSSGTTSGR